MGFPLVHSTGWLSGRSPATPGADMHTQAFSELVGWQHGQLRVQRAVLEKPIPNILLYICDTDLNNRLKSELGAQVFLLGMRMDRHISW